MAKVKLVDIAQENIREMIENKEYDDCGFLPSEGEMTIKFDMSRATIREAVRSMEVRGFVQRIHGKGVKVLDNSVEVVTRSLTDMMTKETEILDDLLDIRVILEPDCAALAAFKRTDADVKILENYVDIMEKSKEMDDAYYEADLSFHTALAKASGNKVLYSFISAYTSVLQELIIETSHFERPLEQIFHYHRNILNAVKEKDESMAMRAMQIHIEATYRNRDSKYQVNK